MLDSRDPFVGAKASQCSGGNAQPVGSDDEREFTEFVGAHFVALVRTGMLLTGDRGTAEDLVQSALMRTFRSWSRVREPAADTKVVMARLAIRWGRRRWRAEMPGATPDQGLADADHVTAAAVFDALGRIDPKQRAVLVLRYWDGMIEQEIATALGCARETVKSRAARGLAALRDSGLLVEQADG